MHPALDTSLTKLLGCRYPIIQTAMGWVSRPELVAASCNAGAFGFLAAASLRADEVGPAIARIRELSDRPFGVNFHLFQPGAAQIVDTLIAERVRAVSFGRGPDKAAIKRFRDAGIICIPTVGALRHAQKMVEIGVDALTIQGGEGGGHTGSVPTTILLPQVLDAVRVPVVAAGGFRDGRGLAAALAYGAAGIAMGTRFLMSAESPVPTNTTDRYKAASVADVIVTSEIDGMPQRVVVNELVQRLESSGSLRRLAFALRNALAYRRLSGASIPQLLRSALAMQQHERLTRSQLLMSANAPMLAKKAMQDGDPVNGYLPSGSVAGLIDDRPGCGEIVARIVREAEQTLARLAQK